jgi:hypothetical protein
MCLEDIGRKAAGLLLRAVGGEHPSGLHILPGRPVQRDPSVPG